MTMPLPTFNPSTLSAPIIQPTIEEFWSAPFRVAPKLNGGTVPPHFQNVPTEIVLLLTAPNGQTLPIGAFISIYRVDSQGNAVPFVVTGPLGVGDYIAHKPQSVHAYGLDAIGYSSDGQQSM